MLRTGLTLAAIALGAAMSTASAEPFPTAAPESVGISAERLDVLTRALEGEVAKGAAPGAVIAVARRGKLVHFKTIGVRDPATKAPMPADAIFSIASMTKPMVSVAIMMLHDEGRLFLSDPIGRHLPQLAAMKLGVMKADGTVDMVAPKRQPTIQDLLRHTSGLTYGGRGETAIHKLWPASSGASAQTYTGPEFLAKIATAPLLYEPGTVWDYSLSVDVLGLIVEKITEKPLSAFLAEHLWTPLGMVDTSFALPEGKANRYALAYPNDPLTGKPQFVLHAVAKPLKFECGGGCGLSTAMDYLRFSQMLLNGGTLDGRRYLARKSLDMMTSDQLAPEVRSRTTSMVLAKGYGFGLGFAVRTQTGLAELAGSTGDYNWGGAYGTYFWVDPKEQLTVVYMAAAPGDIRNEHRTLVKNLVLQALVD